MFFFSIKNYYGGGGLGEKGIRMKHTFFENFPIPLLSEAEQIPFINLVDQILSAKKENPAADTKELEKQIDDKVYELYGLTKEEIEIVEGK